MKKWEPKQVKRLAIWFGVGVLVGIILSIIFKNAGLFLPLGGIVGMCIGVCKK